MRANKAKLAEAVRRLRAGESRDAVRAALYDSPTPDRRKAASQPGRVAIEPLRLPCVHEGPVLEWCHTCQGELKHVRECDLHEKCTRGLAGPLVRSCVGCGDYATRQSEQGDQSHLEYRHLLYHVWPVKGPGIWQLNLDRLRKRLPLFNGRRVIAIVEDKLSEPAERVKEYLAGERIDEWVVTPNNPVLREVETWPLLWSRVAHLPGVTFYGHAKGVSRPFNPGVSIHRWANLLYQTNLDHWPVIAELLSKHAVAGAMKKVGRGFQGSQSAWHFTGTFFWARNDAVGARWQTVDRQWWGTESWVGIHWRPEEAGCHFGAGTVNELDCYRLARVERLEAEYEAWRQTQPAWTTPG